MKYITLLFVLLSHLACTAQPATVSIIPQPLSMKVGKEVFVISKNTVIATRDQQDRKSAEYLRDYIRQYYGIKLDIDRQEGKDYIRLVTRNFVQAPEKDAYNLEVAKDGITIEGDTHAGTFYGIQTLIQLLPAQPGNNQLPVSFLTIQDAPRFAYRGMHFDVTRHFFPIEYVKKYIDYLALHKLNYFHWHLTDDQGWRIEIKKHPALMAVAAWRNGTIIGRYPGIANDNIRYGGYYTQEEVKEVVQYAADRFITVIPEIEMPGHSSAAIAAYPWLSCFPEEETIIPSHPSEKSKQMKGKKVQETWGVFEDVYCAGKDSTFQFLEEVLTEVIPLFPSKYVHIGGDESPKANWKRCPNCQARIKSMGLKDEHELQSYFVQRMEKFVNSKGKTIIGWDEILEGGLAPNAVVMSWQSEKGGIEAAKQNHHVIMTPQKPLYFDHSQTKNEDSVVIGGYNPIEAVYAYDPVSSQLPAGKVEFILGGQANLWTEYIKNPAKVEYKLFPRMSALSEILWTSKEKKNWNDFEKRLATQFKRYDLWKVNYSRAYYDVRLSLLPASDFQGIQIKAEPRDQKGELSYSFGQGQDKTYIKPFKLKESGDLVFTYKRNNQVVNTISIPLHFNKATGKKVSITRSPNERYPGQGGAFSLLNGIYSNKGLSHPDWLGWIGDDMVATIDLRNKTEIDSVRVHTLDQNGSWVYLPQYIEVQISSDGKNFSSAGRSSEFVKDTLTMGWITVRLPKKQSARYIKVIAKNYGTIPMGKPGGGSRAWLFADEIQVY